MTKRYALLVLVVLLLGAGAFAASRLISGQPRLAQATPPGFGLVQDYLGLTPEQREKFAQVDARFGRERLQLRERIWQAREDVVEVLRDPASTREQALDAVDRLGEAQREMQRNTVEYLFELRRHLTSAQREKLIGTMGRGMCASACGLGAGRGMGAGGKGGRGQGRGRMGRW